MTPLLTDDEVVALSASGGSRWSTPLPTVAIEDDREMGAALARGVRSLRLRGLLTGESGQPELVEGLSDFVRGAQAKPVVLAEVVRVGQSVPMGGAAVASPISSEEVLVDLITSAGIHDYEVVTPSEAVASLQAFIQQIFEAGPTGPQGSASAMARLVVGEDLVEIVRGSAHFAGEEPIASWADVAAKLVPALSAALAGQ